MNRCALLLCLLFLFSCSKNSEEIASPVVGRWTLVAQQDSAGVWANFIPFVPVQFEFRADGTFDYLDAAGKPKRECCQPTAYQFAKPAPCPLNAGCLLHLGRVQFSQYVPCPTVYCAPPAQEWYILAATEQFLDVIQSNGAAKPAILRYQRTR